MLIASTVVALLAIALTELALSWQLPAYLAIATIAGFQLFCYRRSYWRIAHEDQSGRWQINQHSSKRTAFFGARIQPSVHNKDKLPDTISHTGPATLIRAGYRSPILVVLVFRTENSSLLRLPVWKDQLSARQFSYLHHQMLFTAH